eukprot:TRINITY_DN2467_c0_g1_i1.p1 TRINITY_DN2467_c0_g1~~TRINITY_DN2467_c0_g1_i1.p1  ORF type:complete len:616 (+),score=203.47 TRINITY_DN2467_c0_g1_i1:76-1848(+)
MSWADQLEDQDSAPRASPWANTAPAAPAPAAATNNNVRVSQDDYPRLDQQQQRKAPAEDNRGRREDSYDNRGRGEGGRGGGRGGYDNRGGHERQDNRGYDNRPYDNRQDREHDNRPGYDNRPAYDNRQGRGGYDNRGAYREERRQPDHYEERRYEDNREHHEDRRQPEHYEDRRQERDNRGHYDNDRRGGYNREYSERRPPQERVERPKNPIPDHPPYTSFISNLSWNASENDLGDHFANAGCQVDSVKIIIDRVTNRSKGHALVFFADRESLEKAVTELDGSQIMDRALRVDVHRHEEKPKREGGFGDRGRDNSFFTKSRENREPAGEGAPPAERPKLNILPRSTPLEKNEPAPTSSTANPFGAARPRDEEAWQRKQEERERGRKEAEEKKLKESQETATSSTLSSSSSSVDKPHAVSSPASDKKEDFKSTKPEAAGGRRQGNRDRDNKEHHEGGSKEHRFRNNIETTWEPKEPKEVRDAQRAAAREPRDSAAKDNKAPHRDNKDNRPPRDTKDKPAAAGRDAKPAAEKGPQGAGKKQHNDNKPAEKPAAPAPAGAKEGAKTKAPPAAPAKKAAPTKVTNAFALLALDE